MHNGNHYGLVNNYHYPSNGGLPPDANQNQGKTPSESNGQSDIALAMELLSFVRMDNRQANIQKAYLSTCKWIFGKTAYKNWRNADLVSEHNGFFWIKSKPGAGKSTLMKFLVQSAAKQLPDDHVISFFFNARGEVLERSLEGLYRGLLHQLFTAVPRLQEVLNRKEVASSAHQAWPLNSLKSIFSEAVTKLGQDRVTCFIDALDECPESEIRDMIEFFEELSESTAEEDIGFRVCFSSRHYPQITMMKCQPMVLDGQDGHEDDIARYVKSKLKVRKGKTAEEVRTAVQTKAKGIFMWVVLVVRILNEESDRGSNNAKLRQCLDRIPAELHDLFQDILQRGIQDNKHLVPILQWISFAQSPLTREELYFAVHSGDPDFVASEPWDPDEDDAESMDLFILETSKGLAEMTRGKKPTVQFIHESVRDYLRETGFAALAPELSGNLLGLTHDYLKRCCLSYITDSVLARLSLPVPLPKAKSEEAKSLRKKASAMFPFLEYATDSIVSHAELACANGVDQAEYITAVSNEFGLSSVWRVLASLFAVHDTRRYVPYVSIARKFAYVGAEHLLRSAFLGNAHQFGFHDLRMAFHAAIKSRNVKLIKVLLSIIEIGACLRFTFTKGFWFWSELLIQAVRSRDTTVVTTLLEDGNRMPAGSDLEELLSEISKAGNVEAIRYLSARGANVSACSAEALHIAIIRGLDDVAKVLIELGVPSDRYIGNVSQHPLVEASNEDRAGIVRMLIMSDTCTITPHILGMSLLLACAHEDHSIARMLLDCCAPVDFLDPGFGTPLIQACKSGHLCTVNMLLEAGADISLEDDLSSPIAAACEYRRPLIVEKLLESGADPNSPSDITPLLLAFYSVITPTTVSGELHYIPSKPDETCVRLLLSRSADPNVRCRIPRRLTLGNYRIEHTDLSRAMLSRTLMYGAAIMDNAELLRLLFESGADANTEDGKDYFDALQDSCRNGREEVVKVLLANGASVARRDDDYYRDVVKEATALCHSRIVKLLLTEGHVFRTQSRYVYSDSLQIAVDLGCDEIVRFLMDMGVETSKHVESGGAPDATLPPSSSG